MILKKYWFVFLICFCCSLFIGSIASPIEADNSQNNSIENKLPSLKTYPLPNSLERWQDPNNSGDYFDEVTITAIGQLIWSDFPVKIYLDRPTTSQAPTAEVIRFQKWFEMARRGIAEWNEYLPLIEVEGAEMANIIVTRKQPALDAKFDRATGKFTIPRARTAQTRYEFYFKPQHILAHRMTVQISPNLNDNAIASAVRHELGHALGIWGHSPTETDVMFFSQVRDAPKISPRDINTLKKIYQQPTRLGSL
jgi:predicted Zn-dependent protease